MLTLIRKLASVLDMGERKEALVVFSMMIFAALLEVVGVASILPFISVLSNPVIIEKNSIISAAYNYLGFVDQRNFLVFLGVVVLIVFLASLIFRAIMIFSIQHFALMRIHTIGLRLLSIYMGQPYEFFLHRNSAGLGKALLAEVATVASNVLLPTMRALSGVIVAVAIIGVLLVIQPASSLILSAFFVSSYGTIDWLTRKRIGQAAQIRLKANGDQYRIAGEAIQGLKELRVLGRESDYINRFREPSRLYSYHDARISSTREMPFYIIQGIAFGGMLVMLLFWIVRGDDLHDKLPLISFFAFAGYRLLPAFQDIFRSVGQIRFAMPVLDQLVADISLSADCGPLTRSSVNPLPFQNSLKLENVTFRYRGAEADTLTGLSLALPARGRVALVGHTGAGKSTIADLILGLLRPTTGRILVDGVELDEGNLRDWQADLGYVPQQIYLADDTVAANIAFGVPKEEIDYASVERAARRAQIYDFIVSDLPLRFETMIGERGARLSGGQRQRLGIARALYCDPKVVVFDEATSALDNQTEAAVIESIEQLGRDKTVILVAHRLSTIKSCERICLIDNGRLVASGAYDDLLETTPLFRELVDGTKKKETQ